jgi:hypothetical protein
LEFGVRPVSSGFASEKAIDMFHLVFQMGKGTPGMSDSGVSLSSQIDRMLNILEHYSRRTSCDGDNELVAKVIWCSNIALYMLLQASCKNLMDTLSHCRLLIMILSFVFHKEKAFIDKKQI